MRYCDNKITSAFLLIFTVYLIQVSAISEYLRVFNTKPDLLIASVAIFSFIFDLRKSIILALFAGLLKDTSITFPFALYSILFVIWILVIKYISNKLVIRKRLIRLGILALVILLNNLATEIALSLKDAALPAGLFLRTTILESIYTLIVAILLFRLISASRTFNSEVRLA